MNRWILLLSLWGAQAFAKPAMKPEPVEAKVLTPSYVCQAGPFEVSFVSSDAKYGQQIRLELEAAATGVSLGYQVTTSQGLLRDGNYQLTSTSNTIDPCAPVTEAPAPQTNSMTVAPKPQSVGPVTVVPGPVTVTVVTPPSIAPLVKDQLIVTLPPVAPGEQITLKFWSVKPILAKSMHFSLEQIVPVDPVAYAEWEAKQAAKAEARAERAAKREARREARVEARQVKIALKTREKQRESAVVSANASVQVAAQIQVKTQKAAKKQTKMTLRLERRRIRAEKRELRLAPKREAQLIAKKKQQAITEIKIERRHKRRMIRNEKRSLKSSVRHERRAPIKELRIKRRHHKHELRIKVRIERRDRRVIHAKEKRIAREPKVVIRTHKHWERYLAKDKKLQLKISKLKTDQMSKRDWLESRRYNMFTANVSRVENVYESLLTADLKAKFEVELYAEVMALKPAKDAAYKLYVDARNLENAQTTAAASLETSNQTTVAAVESNRPPMPAPLTEYVAPAPAPDASWSAGYWQWNGAQYIWIEGHWVMPLPTIKVVVQKDQKTTTTKSPKPAGYSTSK